MESSHKQEESDDVQQQPSPRKSMTRSKRVDKESSMSMPSKSSHRRNISANAAAKTRLLKDGGASPNKDKPKSLLKTETLYQGSNRFSKTSLDSMLSKDNHKMNSSTKSLDSSGIFQKLSITADAGSMAKNYASTGTLDTKLGRKPKTIRTSSTSVCGKQRKVVEASKIPGLTRKSLSSRNLGEPKENDRRRRRAQSVREVHHKDRNMHARPQLSNSDHVRRPVSKSSHDASKLTGSGSSPTTRSPRKSVRSIQQSEIDLDSEVAASPRKFRTAECQERKKKIVQRKESDETDLGNRRQLSRRQRQSSLGPKKDALQKANSSRHFRDLSPKRHDLSPKRYAPLRAPSGGADLLASDATNSSSTLRDSKSHISTVGTADDLTDSEQGAEYDISPRNDASHSCGVLGVEQTRSPRARTRHRVRVTDMRQLGKQSARQIFMNSGRGSLPFQSDDYDVNLSDESSLTDNADLHGPEEPPAQFEIALDALNRDSPLISRPGLMQNSTGVSKRLISVTKSPFKVAGKLFKKASAAGGGTEYSLPGSLPLVDDLHDRSKDAKTTIKNIGITNDQLEMLKKAGLKITAS